jgi:aminoglycoside 3-N-acetyltransferase
MEGQVISLGDLAAALAVLDLDPSRPVIAHASLTALGKVAGGAQAVLQALLDAFDTLVMPTFTYKTMLTPEVGPPFNGVSYGGHRDRNFMAEFFHPQMPADHLMGVVAESLRRHPRAQRSRHPILSFSGVNAGPILARQTISDPLGPIQALAEAGGWALLMGVDHDVNTSLHYAELLAGRKQFTRWALTPQSVLACPRFPGCSDGFIELGPWVAGIARRAQAGTGWIQAFPLPGLIEVARGRVQAQPLALLCRRPDCARCRDVRSYVRAHSNDPHHCPEVGPSPAVVSELI